MAALTNAQKEAIDRLADQGKSNSEIAAITGVLVKDVYRHVNRIARARYDLQIRKAKKANAGVKPSIKPVKEMPPIYKSELKIIVDKDLAELACQQMGLSEPVASLADRPNSYNVNGWNRVGDKWVAGSEFSNNGRVKHVGVGSQL